MMNWTNSFMAAFYSVVALTWLLGIKFGVFVGMLEFGIFALEMFIEHHPVDGMPRKVLLRGIFGTLGIIAGITTSFLKLGIVVVSLR